MKILVTGALGFVGINILRDLASAGHAVVGVDVVPPDALASAYLGTAPPTRTLIADLAKDDFGDALPTAAPDVAIHAAAVTPLGEFEEGQAVLAAAVNVAGTARFMRWASRSGVRRVVHVSTGSVYGPVPGPSPVAEDTAHWPDGVYGITKSAGERLAARLAALGGISLCIVRLSHVYGPMERASTARAISSPVERWTRAMIAGEPIGAPREGMLRDFIHVADVTRAIGMLAARDEVGAFNLSSGRQTSEPELVEHLREIEPGLRIGEAGEDLVSSPRRPPLSIDRIGRAVGWQPLIELQDGLRSYVAWRRASGG
jgi:nucleoside-diphosphate-sugar epimerase